MASYLKSYTGHKIDPLEPKIQDIELKDIAHALSLVCRGNGQVKHFYSVGQHSINAYLEAKERDYSYRVQLACLLHDGAEAYISDLIRPVKNHLSKYDDIENNFLKLIFEKYGLSDLSEDEWILVKSVDDDLVYLLDEPIPAEGFKCKRNPDIEFEQFDVIEQRFLQYAYELINKLKEPYI